MNAVPDQQVPGDASPVQRRLRVALWAVPRSVSTALERSFMQRSDTATVHEPFTDCYYFSDWRRSTRYGDYPHLHSYSPAIARQRIEHPRAEVVLMKELCFQAVHYIDDSFLSQFVNTFIIRHPSRVFASLSRLKPDASEEEVGFLGALDVWRRVREDLGQETIVLDGDQLRRDPVRVLKSYCDFIDLPFDPTMLAWQPGAPLEWGPHEKDSQSKWHATLSSSRGWLPGPTSRDSYAALEAVDGEVYERAVEIYNLMMGDGRHRSHGLQQVSSEE